MNITVQPLIESEETLLQHVRYAVVQRIDGYYWRFDDAPPESANGPFEMASDAVRNAQAYFCCDSVLSIFDAHRPRIPRIPRVSASR